MTHTSSIQNSWPPILSFCIGHARVTSPVLPPVTGVADTETMAPPSEPGTAEISPANIGLPLTDWPRMSSKAEENNDYAGWELERGERNRQAMRPGKRNPPAFP